jgi:methionyl aminopeptidase
LKVFNGYGIGRNLHEDPQVLNFGPPHTGPIFKPGTTLATESMLTFGSEKFFIADDDWRVKNVDGKFAVHCEHPIVVAKISPEFLTLQINDFEIRVIEQFNRKKYVLYFKN